MAQPVSRTIALHGLYVHALGAALFAAGCILPVWAVYHRTQIAPSRLEIPAGPLRPEMLQLPRMASGTTFAISETEVTQFQFYRVLRRMPEHIARTGPRSWDSCPAPLDFAAPDMPLTCISAADAAAYANGLTEIENRDRVRALTLCYDGFGRRSDRSCTGYRLPTAAEWTHAATEDRPQSYAETEAVGCARARLPHCTGDTAGPFAVKDLQASPWHLHGMYGNVSEMVENPDGSVTYALGGSWQHAPDTAAAPRSFPASSVGMRIVRAEARPAR